MIIAPNIYPLPKDLEIIVDGQSRHGEVALINTEAQYVVYLKMVDDKAIYTAKTYETLEIKGLKTRGFRSFLYRLRALYRGHL